MKLRLHSWKNREAARNEVRKVGTGFRWAKWGLHLLLCCSFKVAEVRPTVDSCYRYKVSSAISSDNRTKREQGRNGDLGRKG